MVGGHFYHALREKTVESADVHKSPERACHLAKTAFDDAVLSVDLSDDSFDQTVRDSMAILQLLMDDLVLWSGEMQGQLASIFYIVTDGVFILLLFIVEDQKWSLIDTPYVFLGAC